MRSSQTEPAGAAASEALPDSLVGILAGAGVLADDLDEGLGVFDLVVRFVETFFFFFFFFFLCLVALASTNDGPSWCEVAAVAMTLLWSTAPGSLANPIPDTSSTTISTTRDSDK
ncbi:MAG: hypothetical protein JW841_14045 [Deltaproteobacteria bacterium]|nr:hypothetical protein [Deltaproteobacteria bacterium]